MRSWVLRSSVPFSSVTQSCPTLCDPMNPSTPGWDPGSWILDPVHHQLPEFTQTHVHWSVMPSNHLILCCPLLLLPSIFPSIRVFSNESALHIRWSKDWSFSFSVSPSSEHPGLVFFRMDWLDLLAVQGSLKSLLQHHSSKSINSLVLSFLHSPTLTSIHDHWKTHSLDQTDLYMTTGKTIDLTRWTFVGKAMSLLFNMLSRLVITFLPRSKRLLISWLWLLSAVILEPKKIKSDTVSTVSPSISHEVMGPDAMIYEVRDSLCYFNFFKLPFPIKQWS